MCIFLSAHLKYVTINIMWHLGSMFSDTHVITRVFVEYFAEIKAVGRQDVDENDNNDGPFWGISHGVYAGISCGILFVACVALLTAMHYKKRYV